MMRRGLSVPGAGVVGDASRNRRQPLVRQPGGHVHVHHFDAVDAVGSKAEGLVVLAAQDTIRRALPVGEELAEQAGTGRHGAAGETKDSGHCKGERRSPRDPSAASFRLPDGLKGRGLEAQLAEQAV
jgi:hypothetical protein